MTETIFMWVVVILLFVIGAAIERELKLIVDALQDIAKSIKEPND